MSGGSYDDQRRGDRGAYERYLAGMDASMRQKVALTAAHLLCRGRVADMGMGSGTGSDALASLYPELEVVGVDVDPTMVEMARLRFSRENLSFEVGDIAAPVFAEGSLDGIFDSSVLHHVTSFGGYRHENAARALEVQTRELRPHGVLIVRDFVGAGEEEVFLDVRCDDGDDSDDPRRCSTAALFRRFAREFRSLSAAPGFPFRAASGSKGEGWARFCVSHRHAVEFVLRKDYRTDWEAEVKEEYTYLTQPEFEAVFERIGLRLLASTPLHNPWIVKHRFAGKIELARADGTPLELPPTNYVIVGEKVAGDEGVAFAEVEEVAPPGFLELTSWENPSSGAVRDLVRRPHATVDILPWFEARDELFVLARMSYPRPILGVGTGSPRLGGFRPAVYVSEPLNVLQTDKPLGQTVEEALARAAAIGPDAILGMTPGSVYYPSPGGIAEEVRSVFVRVRPSFVEERIPNVSSFGSSGRVRALEVQQLLRAAQVGGLPDARLELNTYSLLLQRGRAVGPWIGATIDLAERSAPPEGTTLVALAGRPPRRSWRRAGPGRSAGFLSLRSTVFEERSARGTRVARAPLEHVSPRRLSTNTVAAALLRRHGGEAWLGVDDDDLPAAQCFVGNSEILVTPAYRLPRDVASLGAARDWVRGKLREEYGILCGESVDLGGLYHPSAGLTAEAVYPVAFEVTSDGKGSRRLSWLKLADLVAHLPALVDGHLRVVVLRAAHAVGLLS